MSCREAAAVIVGAGPVGLTLAIALAQFGVDARVIEQSGGVKTEPRAAIVWQRAEEVWGRLGVMPRILAAANPLAAIDFGADGKELGSLALGSVSSEYPHPLIVEQHVIERLLVERLGELGVAVEWNAQLVDLRLGADGAELDVCRRGEQRETIRADWVVGCDGAGSPVRRRAGILFPGRRRRNLQCLTMDAVPEWRYSGDDRSRGRLFLAPNAAVGCFPLPGYDGRACRFYTFAADPRPESDIGDPTAEEMRSLIARAAGAPELTLALTEPRWLGRARFQDRFAETLRRGRALLAGDSAHVWAPIAGHGMTAGLVGAGNLAWKLAAVIRGEAREGLLDTYTAEQTAIAKLILRQTHLDLVETPHPAPAQRLLAAAIPAALRVGALRSWIDHALSSLPISYHGRSFLADGYGEHAHLAAADGKQLNIRPGDRFPGRALGAAPAAGTPGGWTLLLAASDKEQAASLTHLHSIAALYRAKVAAAHLSQPAGSRQYVIVIRPDGHVGAVASGADCQGAVTRYLDTFLLSRSGAA